MKLLAMDASILTKASISRQLTDSFVTQWQRIYPETEVVYRDLHAQPINRSILVSRFVHRQYIKQKQK